MGYKDPENFIDRELSWLAFNYRVLEEALDPATPLLERVKFLGIVSTNLDEFFMIRVSGVQEQIMSGVTRRKISGMTPALQFELIHQEVHRQIDALYKLYFETLIPELEKEGIAITTPSDLGGKTRKELALRFEAEVFPVLTPLAVDAGHPFPHLRNRSLNIITRLQRGGRKGASGAESVIAIVQVPSVLPRFIEVPSSRASVRYVLLEDLIIDNLGRLFPGMHVMEAVPFRVTRNADIEYKELESEDLLKYIETEIRERERGMAVRLQIDARASEQVVGFLATQLNLVEMQIYRCKGPIALSDLSAIYKIEDREQLRDEAFAPSIRPNLRDNESIFPKIRRQDILIHQPYESFAPVLDFIAEAARDPKVLAIKQTLYRTSGDSPVLKSLIEAALNGKQVAAVVELKARFDEENNIVWARQLEDAGVHVVYGLVGLKTHCKIALVVRREDSGIRRYVHVGSGNYNPTTARLYTDIGLFTCDPGFCDDASDLFNLLTGYAHAPSWQRMVIAPGDLRGRILELIIGEREKAEAGKPARIRAKLNSLVDQAIIIELYKASCAGVPIDLNIRGICCLRPGVKGLSETIRVWSIVDRFLEHSRLYIFGEDPDPVVFGASADWMDRNMDRRVEIAFPIMDKELARRCVQEIFGFTQRDNVKARYMGPDGKYRRVKPRAGEPSFRSQEEFLKLEEDIAEKSWDLKGVAASQKVFTVPQLPSAPKSQSSGGRKKKHHKSARQQELESQLAAEMRQGPESREPEVADDSELILPGPSDSIIEEPEHVEVVKLS